MAITIMVVDDSKLARIVAGKAIDQLQPEWVRVEAANADEAVALVNGGDVDVALLDYNMPGKNGLELASELRGLRPFMPIAVITANTQDEVIAQARAINAAFVGKPVTAEALRGFLDGAALRLRGDKK
ncbi:response regulator transcription factor [Acetobacteraceae bacterium H6797]|nr:response regulator transcription factor [Acetobacteraceae bacterium H6797]